MQAFVSGAEVYIGSTYGQLDRRTRTDLINGRVIIADVDRQSGSGVAQMNVSRLDAVEYPNANFRASARVFGVGGFDIMGSRRFRGGGDGGRRGAGSRRPLEADRRAEKA